ncbi:MAG: hypothetical protein M1834_003889 [Cirrosporium novae-zelandiae]|nr:MAG: hypothetical protein M1834_003889 [Cirrosporium novae-zelandiae]
MSSPLFRVKAIYDYNSPEEDDLSFSSGQVITVTEEVDAEWFSGKYTDTTGTLQEGLFPKNHVEKFEPEIPSRPARPGRPKSVALPPPTAVPAAPLHAEELEDLKDENTPTAPTAPPEPPVETSKGKGRSSLESTTSKQPPVLQGSPKVAPTPPTVNATSKPPPSSSKPPPAPKPTGNSFKDRIAAFNKAAAPPISPFKPGGSGSHSGGFIKKPFVAPPPSRNAYVPMRKEPPPQKIYRREEDPDIVEPRKSEPEPVQPPVTNSSAGRAPEEDDQPKPTSLKERIALLQKQQLEAAARHAEAVQKKEKPKRPPKKRADSEETAVPQETAPIEGGMEVLEEGEGAENLPSRPATKRQPTDYESIKSPTNQVPRELVSDTNDADYSGEAEEGDETSLDERSKSKAANSSKDSGPPTQETDVGDEEDNAEEETTEEEQEVDPEIRRRMEIRERMAKMSGGMGMMGMFGPPGGLPPLPGSGSSSRKSKAASESERKSTADSEASARAPPVPIMALPGMQKATSPKPIETELEVTKDGEGNEQLITQVRSPTEIHDVEDIKESSPRRSHDRPPPPPVPTSQDTVTSPASTVGRPPSIPGDTPPRVMGTPPPVPGDRPAPPPVPEGRPTPQLPTMPMSPSGGEMSDDEMSVHRGKPLRRGSEHTVEHSSEDTSSIPPMASPPPPVPNRQDIPRSPQATHSSTFSENSSPRSPGNRRSSRIPLIPETSTPSSPSATRAPPPPPPVGAPPSRRSTVELKGPPVPTHQVLDTSEGEVTEYEGDYDTDIAPGQDHKEALKAHARDSSFEDSNTLDDTPFHSPRSPPAAAPPPPPAVAPRAMPPPPPIQPPRPGRPSGEMPRAPPPPVPLSKQQDPEEQDEDDYDPYRYGETTPSVPPADGRSPYRESTQFIPPPPQETSLEEDLFNAFPPSRHMSIVPPPSADRSAPQPPGSPPEPPVNRAMPRKSLDIRQSLDAGRQHSNSRRSMDVQRSGGDHAFIANDVDFSLNSQWWTQPNTPPPIFQGRNDILYEIEESVNANRDGKTTVSKYVYILFTDYSQTVITAQYGLDNPSDVALEQRHEAPPPRPREDQLENAHTQFGSQISNTASSKQNTTVGDGTSRGLILELLKSCPGALIPVGSRAYGALVYANLANASFQQYDVIRPGDIVTFRNARFQGHRGPMHQKYNIDVGKPDHVGIVVDWDGTKKKIRAWEQGRDDKAKPKVKCESFKVGDLRSGEVKVWRVMSREWVGWEAQK